MTTQELPVMTPELIAQLSPRTPLTMTLPSEQIIALTQRSNWLALLEAAGVDASPVNDDAYALLAEQISQEGA